MTLHAGAPPPIPLALLVLMTLALAIFVSAAIVSELQSDDGSVVAKRSLRSARERRDS
jgi:hypothetical protein